jgi:hypothetical protein
MRLKLIFYVFFGLLTAFVSNEAVASLVQTHAYVTGNSDGNTVFLPNQSGGIQLSSADFHGLWLGMDFDSSDRISLMPDYTYVESAVSEFSGDVKQDDAANVVAPVPLPATAWGFLIGVMSLLSLSKRRNK